MEKRATNRYAIDFKVEILYDGKSYAGLLENISENGLFAVAYPSNRAIDFNSGTKLEIKFQLFSGAVVNLPCEVRWSYVTPPHGSTFSIGAKIIGSSLEYKKFLKSLN